MGKLNYRKNNKNKTRKIPKTRKEIRKLKREQQKSKKNEYFRQKKGKPEATKKVKSTIVQPAQNSEAMGSDIDSDFELSDVEINEKVLKLKNKKPNESHVDRFVENQNKEKKQEKDLQRKMKKRRIEQLQAANEEEDRVIRKLEKQLKIHKHDNLKSIPKMFNDGLDYALELCLPENIQKMYAAAKEAANDSSSGEELEDDINTALGKSKNKTGKVGKNSLASATKTTKAQIKLRKAENQYFCDDDLGEVDSEFEKAVRGRAGAKVGPSEDENHSDVSNVSDNPHLQKHKSNSKISKNQGNFVEDPNDSSFDEEIQTESSKHNHKKQVQMKERAGKVSSGLSDSGEEESSELEETSQNSIWEDIYGRKRDKDGNVIQEKTGMYVPPHVRARLESGTSEKQKERLNLLRKRCKGHLNRLSEANMHKIVSEIENMYSNNPRYDMNHVLGGLITEALITNILTPERMVLEHALLIAVLHANVDGEIGAHFLLILIKMFDELTQKVETLDIENKKLDNILLFLSHMYTFKIFQHTLIYDIISKLTTVLCEKSIECLLLILRSIGFTLRKDDPLALKDLIVSVQKRANESPLEIKENPRLKFMLDVLYAIKNNNMSKIPQYDPVLAEHLKKILKSMLSGGKYVSTINISMEDLLKADERGKWWVVGSAWSGNIKDIGVATNTLKSRNQPAEEKFSEKLLELAKKQRMNTDDRRNVFCILMSAADYVDAFERLLHLAIKDHRIIVSVLIHCCLSEKAFNPYYSVLAQKFCEYDRKYQLACQYALWDKIKTIHSLKKDQIRNLGQFISFVVTSGGLPLSVLKVVEFSNLDKVTLRLVRQIMISLLLKDEQDCKKVFERIAPSTKLKLFKDSLRLFLQHFLLKGKTVDNTQEHMEMLKHHISLVDKILEIDSRVML